MKFAFCLVAVLAAILSVASAGWDDAAKAACTRIEGELKVKNLIMQKQCRVLCTKGKRTAVGTLEDGTACDIIGFGNKKGVCKSGQCSSA